MRVSELYGLTFKDVDLKNRRINVNKQLHRIEGKYVELGTHDELMNIENGQYKALYEMQFKKQEVI